MSKPKKTSVRLLGKAELFAPLRDFSVTVRVGGKGGLEFLVSGDYYLDGGSVVFDDRVGLENAVWRFLGRECYPALGMDQETRRIVEQIRGKIAARLKKQIEKEEQK